MLSFLEVFQLKFYVYSSLRTCYMCRPCHLHWFYEPNNIGEDYKVWSLSLFNFLRLPCTSSFLCPNGLFFSATCPHIPSSYVHSLRGETKLHTHKPMRHHSSICFYIVWIQEEELFSSARRENLVTVATSGRFDAVESYPQNVLSHIYLVCHFRWHQEEKGLLSMGASSVTMS